MKKYIVGICFSMLFFTSCSDWLNVEPKTTVKEEEVFSRVFGFFVGFWGGAAAPVFFC